MFDRLFYMSHILVKVNILICRTHKLYKKNKQILIYNFLNLNLGQMVSHNVISHFNSFLKKYNFLLTTVFLKLTNIVLVYIYILLF